ncbi:hypothetical protein [Stetteria hydrogenophila]
MAGINEVWLPVPLINYVYEVIVRVTKSGERPAKIVDILVGLEKLAGIRPSPAELANTLLKLETLGYIRMTSSRDFEEYLVELIKK